jgi:hypothetical protein
VSGTSKTEGFMSRTKAFLLWAANLDVLEHGWNLLLRLVIKNIKLGSLLRQGRREKCCRALFLESC